MHQPTRGRTAIFVENNLDSIQIDIDSINMRALQLIRELSNWLESSFIELESSAIELLSSPIELESSVLYYMHLESYGTPNWHKLI